MRQRRIKAFIISLTALLMASIPAGAAFAATLQEQMNNMVGPKQQYNTMLSPAYLRDNASEESISPQSGDVSLAQTDYVLPGVNGLDLEIKRIYKSGTANVREMKVEYVDGVWVDQVYSDNSTGTFYEDRYNLGAGMRFSFPAMEIKPNADGSSYKYLHTEAGDVYKLNGPEMVDNVNTYTPETQTIKDVSVKENKDFSNGQADGTSFYMMVNKTGKKTYFSGDGRVLGIMDRYGNTIKFQYSDSTYTVDGTTKTRKLISKIIDTMGREVTIEYKEDPGFAVGPVQNSQYSLEDSYKASQNPNTTDSGDLKEKFQVIIRLPGDKKIIYDKSAVLVNSSKHVIRTRLQRVFDVDGTPKYHYWYDQPELGFTYINGTSYSAYNRYENLTQIDYCRTNRLERFGYNTYTRKLSDNGSMQYRKIFEKTELAKKGFDAAKPNFLDSFVYDVKDRVTYKYTNEADGFGFSEYNPYDELYLKNTYRYTTEMTESNGTVTKYTYNGIQEQVNTEETGKGHKIVSFTEYDEMKFPKKIEKTRSSLENGQVKGQPVKKIENFRYDMYGNLTNYTGPAARRDDKGYPADTENTVVYTYAYDRFHVLSSKTWKQDKDTNCQLLYTIDDKGNVVKEEKVHTADKKSWVVTDYQYDKYGNVTQKTVHSSGNDYVTNYEYGTDANGVDQKGAYLTKQYSTADGVELAKRFAYDFATGNKTAELDGKDNRTGYKYDGLSRITGITYADKTVKKYAYNDFNSRNRQIEYTDPRGNKFLYEYDIFGNQVAYSVYDKDAWQLITGDEYDSQGNKVKETDANGNSVRFVYNSENRLVKKEYWEKDATRKEALTLTYTYGSDADTALLLSLVDEDGYEQRLHYDIQNRLVKSEQTPDKAKYYASVFAYDYVGNVITEIDTKGGTVQSAYDDLGQLVGRKDALGNETRYTYNSLGKPLTVEEPGGRMTEYGYDSAGRVKEERIYKKDAPESYIYKKYTYDKADNPVTLSQGKAESGKDAPSRITEHVYDSMNRVTDEYGKIDDARKSHTHYQYDSDGNRTGVAEAVNEPGSIAVKHLYEYNYAGKVVREEGILSDTSAAGQTAEHGHEIKKYSYDRAGNLTAQEEYNGKDYDKTTLKYDYRNRLTEKVEPFTEEGAVKTTTRTYDRRGNMASETLLCSGEACTTQYQYNGMGKVITRIDPMGGVSRFLYDEKGNRTKEIDPRYSSPDPAAAPGTEYEYDALDRVVKVSVFDGTERTVISYKEYDGRGNVVKEADGEGYNPDKPSESAGNTYEYNVFNNVAIYTSAQTCRDNLKNGTVNYTKKFTYDGAGLVLSETDTYGGVTQNVYYLNGLLRQKTYADGSVESYDYDLTGNAVSVKTDKAGNRTATYNSLFGKPYRMEYPDGTAETFTYAPTGELIQSVDKTGNARYFSYDLLGNLIAKKEYIETDGAYDLYKLTKSTYDEAGNIKSTQTLEYKAPKGSLTGGEEKAAGDMVQYTYDKNGRTVRVTGPDGRETLYAYDKKGNLLTKKQKTDGGSFQVSRYEYDVQSRLSTEALLVDTSETDGNSLRGAVFDEEYTTRVKAKTTYTYYANGQLKARTDANGGVASYAYDLDKKPVEKTDALGNKTTYRYDLNGNMVEEKNAKGISTTYDYDSLGRLLRRKSPATDGGAAVTRYIYDVMGNLKKQIEPNQYKEEKDTPALAETMEGMAYTYDSMNRRLTTLAPGGTVLEYLKYDANGNVVKKVDGLRYSGSLETSPGASFTYDGLGRTVKTADALGGSKSYTYDILGNMTQLTDERSNTTLYAYNPDGTLATVTYADGGQAEYAYDRLGRMISRKDPLGNVTTWSYNSFGSVKAEKDPYGNTLEYKTDLLGNVVVSTDKAGSLTYLTYDAVNRLEKKKIPLETDSSGGVLYAIESYTYDELGNITAKTVTGTKDKLSSRVTRYTYYDNGLVSTVTDSGGALIRNYYDKNGNTVKVERLRAEDVYDVEKFQYDSQNRLTRDIKLVDGDSLYNADSLPSIKALKDAEYPGKLCMITEYVYDILGNKTGVTSPMAFAYAETDGENRSLYTTVYTYDALNRPEKIIRKYNGKDVYTQYTYDKAGNKVRERNERGFETTFTYDKANRVESIIDAMKSTLKYTYDLAGNKLSETDAKGDTVSYAYDRLNRVGTITDAYGKIISRKVYDANGNIVKEIDAKGYLSGNDDPSRYGTLYTYDLAGRLVKKATPEAAAQGKYTAQYDYNQYGELVRQTDGLGNATVYEYDTVGRLTKVTDALGIATRYSYDKLGSKLTMTDGRGKLTRYTYGAFGRLESVTNPGSKTITYRYDLSGNAVCITDRNGRNTVYTYDNRNLLLDKKVTETGDSVKDSYAEASDSIKYTYDEVGNRASMEDESGTYTYVYDGNNRLQEIRKNGAAQISYDYDSVGNVEKVTDLKGFAVTYTYDKSNRMETVAYAGKTTAYTYDVNGRRDSVTYSGGVSEHYTYDRDNQLTSMANKKSDGSIISEYKYTYDLAGRQTTKTDSYGTTSYIYDKAGRVTKVTTPGKTTLYAYDVAGNRTSQSETYTSAQPSGYVDEATGKDIQYILKKSDYTYSSTNTLLKLVERMLDGEGKELARKTTKYTYDDNGNQLRQSISYTLPDNTGLHPAAKGTSYGDSTPGTIDKLVEKTSYTYDGFNRLKTTETVKEGVRTTAEYLYNGDDLRVSKTVKKSDKGYAPEVTTYLYDRQNVILETDANGSVKARYIKGINYIARLDTQNNAVCFLFNGHGDVVQAVTEAGEVKNQYDYDLWGNPTLTIETVSIAIRYAGEYMDAETGLYYLRARYYDPYIGRFVSEDSYWGEDENPLSLNLYTYCSNDPVNFTDPSGHLQQGDDRLTLEAQAQIVDLTNQYFAAKTNAEKQAIHERAEAIRNSSGNVATGNNYSTTANAGFYNQFNSVTSGGGWSNASQWNAMKDSFGVAGSVTFGKDVSMNSLNVAKGYDANITNYGTIGTINTGSDNNVMIFNSGTINSIFAGTNSNMTVKNSGSIGAIQTGDGSDNYIYNSGRIGSITTGKGSENLVVSEGSLEELTTGEGNRTDLVSSNDVKTTRGKDSTLDRHVLPGGKGYWGEFTKEEILQVKRDLAALGYTGLNMSEWMDWNKDSFNTDLWKFIEEYGYSKDYAKLDIKTATNMHYQKRVLFSWIHDAAQKKENKGTGNAVGPTIGPAPTYQPTDTGTITINGVTYKIYVPGYNDGTNSDINAGEWVNVEGGTYTTTVKDFSYAKWVAGFGASDPQDPGIKIEPNYEYSGKNGGSNTVVNEYVQSNGALKKGYGAQLLSSAIESWCNAWEFTPLQVVIQTNGSESRAVIQIGLNSKQHQGLAGKSLITEYDKDYDVKISLDEKHSNDPYTGYISINSNGKFVFTPKVYAGDKVEVGHDRFFSGWETEFYNSDVLKRSMVLEEGFHRDIQGKISGSLYNIK